MDEDIVGKMDSWKEVSWLETITAISLPHLT